MDIRIAKTDAEIIACYPVMRELRPHIPEKQFLSRVRSQENADYQIAFVQEQDSLVSVAGFRISDNLAWGRFLYVDDLITPAIHRSKGYGTILLSWLREFAAKHGCQQLHLDSGTQRKKAHRFYECEGLVNTGFHFAISITPNDGLESIDNTGLRSSK